MRSTRRRKWMWLIATAVVLLAAIGGFLWMTGFGRDSPSADERLAEIEAARAIPDSENAAILYNELLQDPNATSLSDNRPDSLVKEIYSRTLYEPWLGKDHPESAAWVKEHQSILDRLLEASRLQKCRFPVIIDIANTSQMDRIRPMRQWGFLLSMTAHNDVAEGRIDAALTSWQCLLQMGNHLHQQPVLLDHLLANSFEEQALKPVARFIVTGNPTETNLQQIEAMPLPMKDRWAEYDKETRLTDGLILQKLTEGFSPWDHIKYGFFSFRMNRIMKSTMGDESPSDRAGPLYRRGIAAARGIRILVALRRYKNANGRWPESLEEIRSSLSEEIVTDPFNKSSFVYKPAADTFKLYSRGENNIDEEGQWQSKTGDDWPIWPRRGRMPEAEQQDVNEP